MMETRQPVSATEPGARPRFTPRHPPLARPPEQAQRPLIQREWKLGQVELWPVLGIGATTPDSAGMET